MSGGNELFQAYVGGILAIIVIVTALAASLFLYQKRYLALHRDYSKKLIAAHEEERAFVAREVHDDALQRVAIVTHDVGEILDNPAAADSPAQAAAVRQELKDLSTMLRRVAHRLHPAVIDQGGLIPALAQLADDTTRMTSIEVSTRLPNGTHETILERDRSLILYRIAQEALRNTIKHAGATRAEIAVLLEGKSLVMTVTDNGRGFDAEDPIRSSGLGIISMTERARLADGSFALFSKSGQGTTIRVTVPLRK